MSNPSPKDSINYVPIIKENLKNARLNLGLTMKKAGNKAYIDQASISRYENPNRNELPDAFHLRKLAEVYRKSPNALLSFPDFSPEDQKKENAIGFLRLSEEAIDSILSLNAQQRKMLCKILTCKDKHDELIFPHILSDLNKADKQRDEAAARDESFMNQLGSFIHSDLLYKEMEDAISRNELIENPDRVLSEDEIIKETLEQAYDGQNRTAWDFEQECNALDLSYQALDLPLIEQRHLKDSSSRAFSEMIERIIPSYSASIKKEGPDIIKKIHEYSLRRKAFSKINAAPIRRDLPSEKGIKKFLEKHPGIISEYIRNAKREAASAYDSPNKTE